RVAPAVAEPRLEEVPNRVGAVAEPCRQPQLPRQTGEIVPREEDPAPRGRGQVARRRRQIGRALVLRLASCVLRLASCVLSPWPLVLGLWSLVLGPWSLVLGPVAALRTSSWSFATVAAETLSLFQQELAAE